MTEAVHISRADASDCCDISSFMARALPAEWRTTPLPTAEQCRRALEHDNGLAILARENDEVIGLAAGWVLPNMMGTGDTVMLDEFLVAAERRGAGVGTAIVAVFVDAAREIAEPPVQIWATTDHPEEPAATPFIRTGAQPSDLLRQFDWS